jgi:hypothetical protein
LDADHRLMPEVPARTLLVVQEISCTQIIQ